MYAQRGLSLVTGANGHLGNNVVRELCSRGQAVRCGVRNTKNTTPFDGLDCSVVQLDISDEQSVARAMEGVDILYAVAAAFKLWAKNMIKEIYDVNMEATRILMLAAKAANVRRVIFVSSFASLNYQIVPTSESRGYNTDRRNVYYNPKNDSDKLALQLGQELNIDVVVVLPGTLVGADCFSLNESYNILRTISSGKLPLDPNIYLNWCDVKDVATGCVEAASRGVSGQRYILAQEGSTSIRGTTHILQELFPGRKLKTPPRPPRTLMRVIAWTMEQTAALTGSAPQLQTSFVDMFWGLRLDYDTSKAQTELGFKMKPVRAVLKDAIEYLESHPDLTAKI